MSELSCGAWMEALAALLRAAEASDPEGPIPLDVAADRAVQRLLALRPRGKVMLIGNGGSAAIAQHMQNDLAKTVGLRAQVFYDVPLASAIVNDDGWADVFAQPLRRWTDPGDVLIAISSSGRSENILAGVRAATERGADVITISGFDADNPLRALGALSFWVDSHAYGPVEAAHMALGHYLADRAAARA